VDLVPDPLLLRKLVGPGIACGTSGSVARNSDHWTTEAVGNYEIERRYFVPQLYKNC
jgi:hypothetical protein